MENASKAFIIAGGMLIALLVVSSLVIAWTQISAFNKQRDDITTAQQISKFNKEFESYNRQVIRGYDLVSLANLIEDTNTRYTEVEGFKPMEAYVLFDKDYGKTILDQVSEEIGAKFTKEPGIRLTEFKNTYYGYDDSYNKKKYAIGTDEFRKIFKEYYFECTNIVYDGEEEGDPGSARVNKLYYRQIVKK